jgi:phage shock protein PspC (stress-responsive transcriptional regulator)
MRQVVIVSLDNNAFHIDDDAYAALQRYMERAKAGLKNNPDVDEILGDVERAISVKCSAVLTPSKNVVSGEEMKAILEEVGPVAGEPESFVKEPSAPKRLYRQPQGAVVEGVCTGLAEYFNVDVVIFRILFLILAVAGGGLGGGLYLIMVIAVPTREPDPPRVKTLRRIHPVLWGGAIFLFLMAIVGFSAFLSRGVDRAIDVDFGGPVDATPRAALSHMITTLLNFAVPITVIGALTLLFVLLAKYLASKRDKK